MKNGHALDLKGENILPDPETGAITINLTSQAKGYYQCVAFNVHGAALSQVVYLQRAVLDPLPSQTTADPYTGTEGEPFILPCKEAVSVPEATFQWSTMAPACVIDNNPSPIQLSRVINSDPHGKFKL